MCDWIPTFLSNTFPKFVIYLKSSLKIKGPIPKDCQKGDCRHLVENGLHFNRTDLNKGYGGSCPECGTKTKAERKNSKISIFQLQNHSKRAKIEILLYFMAFVKVQPMMTESQTSL